MLIENFILRISTCYKHSFDCLEFIKKFDKRRGGTDTLHKCQRVWDGCDIELVSHNNYSHVLVLI